MKSPNKNGVESLRAFSIVRRDFDAASKPRLVGHLSGEGVPSDSHYCLIGLRESWVWFSTFEILGSDGLIAVSSDNSSSEIADKVLYLLPSEFQPPISFLLLDEDITWDELTFHTGLSAVSLVLGTDGNNWRKMRPIQEESELLEGETLVAAGWDHEHCSICNKHIVPVNKYFFKAWGDGGSFLCEYCHGRFAKTHSVQEVIYPGEGERVNEED